MPNDTLNKDFSVLSLKILNLKEDLYKKLPQNFILFLKKYPISWKQQFLIL